MFQAPYRAAVIGRTGRGDYGHNLDLAVLGQPKLKVVAVADENEAGRAKALARLGITQGYADHRKMLDEAKPQFVVVAPRWIDCHRQMILDCVERGIHVLTEKPLARDLEECDAIIAAAERAHVKIAVAFQTRYGPRYERIKELIAQGTIGEVLEIRGRGKEDRRGGGEDLLVLGPHLVDLFRGFLGDAAWCFARVSDRGRPADRSSIRQGAEGLGPLAGDRIDAMYGFAKSPAIAHFETARPSAGAGKRFGLQIHGAKGVIHFETGWLPPARLLLDETWHGSAGGSKWTEISSAGLGKPEPLSRETSLDVANKAIVADLIEAVENDRPPLCSVYDGRAALEMLLACHASHRAGGMVALPLADRKHPLA
ncbi:MAG: Gfo/Idh/MocA family oxidoreductase [Isosphaeraceae bacterium]|nr:Gfo/Idh/MocA family oxidoreductase [Isosphaeraceae bacterium]